MSTQPEALRLASELTDDIPGCPGLDDLNVKAAAELRRQHAECNDLARQLNESNERNGRLKAQRDALLEALRQARRCLAWACEQRPEFQAEYDAADAAIKAAEERQ